MPAGSDYVPRGLRKKWKVDALKLTVLLLALTLIIGLRAWSTMSAANML